jgi:AhpD family alkylhydroperoxidase
MSLSMERVQKASPEHIERAMKAMYGLEAYVAQSGLERSLIELVKTRASQLNGCGYCIDMHTKDAGACGESEQRLYLLAAWQESPFYNERERAALLWTDAVTFVAAGHVSDDTYEAVRQVFSEDELVSLTWAVATINAWNRICIGLRSPVGTYQPVSSLTAAHEVRCSPRRYAGSSPCGSPAIPESCRRDRGSA